MSNLIVVREMICGIVIRKCDIARKVFMEDRSAVGKFIEGLVFAQKSILALLVLTIFVKMWA